MIRRMKTSKEKRNIWKYLPKGLTKLLLFVLQGILILNNGASLTKSPFTERLQKIQCPSIWDQSRTIFGVLMQITLCNSLRLRWLHMSGVNKDTDSGTLTLRQSSPSQDAACFLNLGPTLNKYLWRIKRTRIVNDAKPAQEMSVRWYKRIWQELWKSW